MSVYGLLIQPTPAAVMTSHLRPLLLLPNRDFVVIPDRSMERRTGVSFILPSQQVEEHSASPSLFNSLRADTATHGTGSGIARIVVGGNERQKSSPQLLLLDSNSGTLERANRRQGVGEMSMNMGKGQDSTSATRQSGDGSNSPLFQQRTEHRRLHLTGKHEDDGQQLTMEDINGENDSGHKLRPEANAICVKENVHLQNETNVKQGVVSVRGNHSGKRRKGQYSSVQEYEKIHKNSSSARGLNITSGLENIAPLELRYPLAGKSPAMIGSSWRFQPGKPQQQVRDECSMLVPVKSSHQQGEQEGRISIGQQPSQLDVQPKQMPNKLRILSAQNSQPK